MYHVVQDYVTHVVVTKKYFVFIFPIRSGNNPSAQNGGEECVGDSEEEQICNLTECPTECVCEPVTCEPVSLMTGDNDPLR